MTLPRSSAIRRTERSEHERGVGRGGEVRSDLRRVIARVLVVLVERHAPWDLLRRCVDLDIATDTSERLEHLSRDLSDCAVGGQRDAFQASVTVLHDRFVRS